MGRGEREKEEKGRRKGERVGKKGKEGGWREGRREGIEERKNKAFFLLIGSKLNFLIILSLLVLLV